MAREKELEPFLPQGYLRMSVYNESDCKRNSALSFRTLICYALHHPHSAAGIGKGSQIYFIDLAPGCLNSVILLESVFQHDIAVTPDMLKLTRRKYPTGTAK